MALPTTITVTTADGGEHQLTIPDGYAVAFIRCLPAPKEPRPDTLKVHISTGDTRRDRTFAHREVTRIVVGDDEL